VQRRLQDEVDRVLKGQAPTGAQLDQLVYTRNVLNETLRLYPPAAGLERITAKPVQLMGHDLPAGVAVSMRIQSAHVDPRFWTSPLEFKPDRWDSQYDHLVSFA